MLPAMSAAGVTSKDGFQTSMPSAATRFPSTCVISDAGLSSMTMSAPFPVDGSKVLSGAATKNGTLWYLAETARLYVPILLAVSPLSATRSAPTTTASTFPLAMSAAAAESQMRVPGIFSKAISYAVSRAPWL